TTSESMNRTTSAGGTVIEPPDFSVSSIDSSLIILYALTFIERPSVNSAMPALAVDDTAALMSTAKMIRRLDTDIREPVFCRRLCPRVVRLVHLLQPRARDMRVDLRRGYVGMDEHHLDGSQVGAVFEQVTRD